MEEKHPLTRLVEEARSLITERKQIVESNGIRFSRMLAGAFYVIGMFLVLILSGLFGHDLATITKNVQQMFAQHLWPWLGMGFSFLCAIVSSLGPWTIYSNWQRQRRINRRLNDREMTTVIDAATDQLLIASTEGEIDKDRLLRPANAGEEPAEQLLRPRSL